MQPARELHGVISGATFVYLSACDWDAPWHGPQEVARRLGAAGNRVLYVETLGWRRPRGFDLPRVLRRVRRATGVSRGPLPPGVSLISPLLLPAARSRSAQAVNRALLLGAIRRRLGGAGAPLVAWVYTPYRLALDVLDKLPADVVVYHCTQAHRFRPGAPADTARVEEALLERADVVIVDGVELERELVGRHSNLHRVPTGVDPAPYAGARPPGWMRDLPRPVVGYLGSVDHRIDVDVIAGLAKARPRWTLAVIGPVTDATTAELEALPNVILHGQVPPDDVPATLAGFDVGLLPYAPLDMTPYTYPAKLHQYFAAGLPVASVPLPDLEEFGELVNLGEGVSGLVDATERALAEPDTAAAARRRVAAQNSWGHRLDDLSRIVESALDARVPSGERHSKGPELVREKRERGEDRDGQRLGGDLPHPESDEAAQHDEVSP